MKILKSSITHILALVVFLIPSYASTNFAVLSLTDSDGTLTINTTTRTWSYSGAHTPGSGTLTITDEGSYFTVNGSGTYGIDGFLFGDLVPGGGSGNINFQSNSGGSSFNITDTF